MPVGRLEPLEVSWWEENKTSTPLIRMFARDIETFEQFINRIKGLFL
jgi:hypothetical protein